MSEPTVDIQKERLAKVVYWAAKFLDDQYINVGKKNIPNMCAMQDAFGEITPDDWGFISATVEPKDSEA